MSNTMYVVPENAGSQLEHPVSGVLPDEGAFWLADLFTFRLIQEGAIAPAVDPSAPRTLIPNQFINPAPEPEKAKK